MPDGRRGRRAAIVATLAAAVLIGQLPASALAKDPPGLDRFLQALGRVESGGRYDARNASSGAYGKYQIMPASWRAWALRYLGDADAPQTARNQEIVASKKVSRLFAWLGGWRFVAHWWLTGSSSRNIASWSTYSKRYVAKVIHYFATTLAGRFVDDAATAVRYAGKWKTARYGAYAGGRAHYSATPGATVSFTFVGRGIGLIGPVGPTRGRAIVSIDGKATRTIDLRRGSFAPTVTLFTKTWTTSGRHTITVRVAGAAGRPVAIEGFTVRT